MNRERMEKTLREHEGYNSVPYKDSLDRWTVGFGHLCSNPLHPEVIKLLTYGNPRSAWEKQLSKDLNDAIVAARTTAHRHAIDWNTISSVRQEALVYMAFQLGPNKLFRFTKMWRNIRHHDWPGACREGRDSNWYKQTTARCLFVTALLQLDSYDTPDETRRA